MTFKLNALAAALALVASVGAQATIQNSNQNLGNSSVLFVAIDNAHTTSITVDLGVNLADFLLQSPAGSTITNSNGTLSGAGTTASWNFGADSYSLNGAAGVTEGNAWASAFSSFTAAVGNSPYRWAIVAADNVTGAIGPNNTVFNRTLLSTGAPTQANINGVTGSASVSNATGIFQNWASATSFAGNHTSVTNGANVAAAGTSTFLWTTMRDHFGSDGNLGWSYLVNVGATSGLFLTQQASNPVIYQLGAEYSVDTLLSPERAATFSFDGTTLSYLVNPVPEPSTYAMLIAGLAALGFMARRRKSA